MTATAPAPPRARSPAGSRRGAGTAPPTAPTLRSVSAKSLFAALARSAEQLHRVRLPRARRRPHRRPGRRATAPRPSARPPTPRPSRLVASTDTCGQRCAIASTDACDRVEEVLAVVEHQQQALRGEIVEHRLLEAPTRAAAAPAGVAASVSHTALRIGDRRELAQPRTVRELADDLRRDLQREAGLADPAHPGQRHQATTDGPAPASDAISASRPTNVVIWRGRLPGSASTDRNGGNSPRQTRRVHLEDPLGSRQVAQAVLTQIDELDRPVAHAARSSPPTPRSDRRAPRSSAARHGSPRCRSSRRRGTPPRRCAHPSAPAMGPSRRMTPPPSCELCVDRGVQRVVRGREHRVEPVTRRLDDVTVCSATASPEDRVVARQRRLHRVGMLLPQTRRTLEIGEQERDRPRRQLRHPTPSHSHALYASQSDKSGHVRESSLQRRWVVLVPLRHAETHHPRKPVQCYGPETAAYTT